MRWRRASRSELPPVGAEVRYDWPAGGGDPFDASAEWISHAHDAYEAALADACTMKDRRVLVGRVLVSQNWH